MDRLKKKYEKFAKTSGIGWRISLSIIISVCWAVFVLLWLFFYAASFSIYQNVAVMIASVLLMGGIQGAFWAPWGIRYGCRCHEIFDNEYVMKKRKRTKRINK